MKTKHDLPPYLGFGILDEQSILQEGEWTLANYTLNNLTVLEVAISDKQAIYTDMWERIKMSSSEYPTLEEAFVNHYQFIDYTRLPVFEYLERLVSNTGNIHIVIPDHKQNQKVIFFPALHLMRFRIPLMDDLVDIFMNNFMTQADPLIKHIPFIEHWHNLYISEVFITKLDGELIKTDVTIIEFITPLAKVYEFAQLITNHISIHREKHLRAILQPWSDEKDETLYFPGNENDYWKSYRILLKGKTKAPLKK